MRFGRLLLIILMLGFASRAGLAAASPDAALPAAERARIERLIEIVGQSVDRTFIRNGTVYDATIAARFLRGKWDYNRDRVHSAEDFVREIGTRSGKDGPAYRVRNADGTEEEGAAFLTRLLRTTTR